MTYAFQFVLIGSCPVTGCNWKQSVLVFFTPSMFLLFWAAQNRAQDTFLPTLKIREGSLSMPPDSLNTAEDTFWFLCDQGSFLAHLQLVNQDTQVLFCKTAFQTAPRSVLVCGVFPLQCRILHFPLWDSCQHISLARWGASELQHKCQLLFPILYRLQTCGGCSLVLSSSH